MQKADDLQQAVNNLQAFSGTSLTETIALLEQQLKEANSSNLSDLLSSSFITNNLLASAYLLKSIAGQINVVIHALGILLTLPHILKPDEKIESLSLGAGNTGRDFDLETNRRIAEFKFIHWQGGAEVIRQNALFKDFYLLAECDRQKEKFLYVLGDEHPLKFFNSGRTLSSVMSRHRKLWNDFSKRHGDKFITVKDYYATTKTKVQIEDISKYLPSLFKSEPLAASDELTPSAH